LTEIARRAVLAGVVGAVLVAGVVFAATRPAPERGAAPAATDRWLPLASSPLTRSEVGAARIGRRIYVAGGYDDATGGRTTDKLAAYDIKTDSWRTLSSMPIGVNHPTATAYRGKLYVHGGFTPPHAQTEATAALQRYDPERDSWKLMPESDAPRAAHALVAIKGKLYAAGGADGDTGELTSLEIYDVAKRRWKRGPDMDVGRNHITAALLKGRLYVIGGRPGNLDLVEVYDPRKRKWSRADSLDTPRSGIASAVVHGTIVVFGGETSAGTIAPVEQYSRGRDLWTPLPEMRTPRHGLGGASRGSRVFALEGGAQPGGHYSNVLEYLDVPKR
jgi:N-acetylneuraminic acid mutarotase